MEPDEISVVLQRASELHAKISDAIERALKSEFLLTAASAGKTLNVPDGASANRLPEEEGEDNVDARRLEEPNAEAKSLGAIRDALETLEDQLECLQTLQQQQRAERDAALADLEESRRILLKRLKSHQGNEWEVVHEALAFAGEPVEERDELPLPPYPHPLSSFTQDGSTTTNQQSPQRITEQPEEHKDEVKCSSILGLPFNFNLRSFAARLFGPGVGVTSRAAMVVAGVITIILFSEMGSRQDKSSSRSHPGPHNLPAKKPPAPPAPVKPPSFEDLKCPPGKVMILQDGLPKCVVKERIEVPFHRKVKSPDVLYGRG